MSIRNITAFVDALWDWGFLDKAFAPSRIKVTDVDGLVESGNHFLFLEGKGKGKAIPRGQEILFERLTARGDTVLILWGDPGDPTHMSIFPAAPQECTQEDVFAFVRGWYLGSTGRWGAQ